MASPSAAGGSAVDWDNRYQTGDTPWEKGAPHPALVAWLNKNSLGGRVLVPGCGSGHDVRALAAQGAEAIGFDIAPQAIGRAEQFQKSGRESYVLGDLFHPPEEWTRSFDAVFEHTCFCAIDPEMRRRYVESVHRLLKPSGKLLAIFYLNPGHDEGGPPYGSSTKELDALFLPGFQLVEEIGGLPTYEGREGREILRLLVKK